jgi:predicted kinase
MTVIFDKPKVIICVGLPASGKSSWAKRMIQENKGKAKLTSKDDLRAMLDVGDHNQGNEIFVLGVRDHIIKESIKAGKSVIVADTNLAMKHETHIQTLAGNRADVEMVFFDVGVETCVSRDKEREVSLGEKIVRGMERDWLNQKNSLGSKPFKVHVITEAMQLAETQVAASNFVKYNPDLPECAIFDIDGTVALMNGKRGPFDWAKVHVDDVNESIAYIVRSIHVQGMPVFAVSGRDGLCKELTENWLTANGIPFDGLFMRPAGDFRKDFIVKQEIFEQNFLGKYNVKFILDDRSQVVKKWRELGLVCLQVASGDF